LKDIQKLITERTGKTLNRDNILSIVFSENVQNDKINGFHYKTDNPPAHKYSPAFVDLVVEKIVQHADYLESCSKRYHNRLGRPKRGKLKSK
jgi:hypothetical protein